MWNEENKTYKYKCPLSPVRSPKVYSKVFLWFLARMRRQLLIADRYAYDVNSETRQQVLVSSTRQSFIDNVYRFDSV